MEYRKNYHCIYGLEYHIVLVTKYRKKVLNEEISKFLKQEIERILIKIGGRLIEVETDLDHVHILAELGPKLAVSEYVRILKTATARLIRNRFKEELKDTLYGDSFWSNSYFISSTGGVTIDTIKKYVENQGKPAKMGRPKKGSSPLG
jgi:putative transposase